MITTKMEFVVLAGCVNTSPPVGSSVDVTVTFKAARIGWVGSVKVISRSKGNNSRIQQVIDQDGLFGGGQLLTTSGR